MLQLDVGTCLDSGGDPAAWIRSNPGRIHSVHLKDWSSDPDKGYKVLFGEGDAKWKDIFAAAEGGGGVILSAGAGRQPLWRNGNREAMPGDVPINARRVARVAG